jgi:O-antigen/teichoic acid export membrane protein
MAVTDRMSATHKILRGSASGVVRLILSVLVATILPPILVHHLSQAEYSAWVLILQLSTYINLLDLGLQTIIGKMIAENHALGDAEGNHRLLSTSFSVLTSIAGVGMIMVVIMVWRVPQLFHQMPLALFPEVRLGLLLIGISAAFGLAFNPFLSVFTGLQSYRVPTVIALLSRILSASLLVVLVLLHKGLVKLTLAIALVNIATAIAQFYGWKFYARRQVGFSFWRLHRSTASKLLQSGGVIAVWSLGELFVSGLDLVLVGHFDYANTGFYAIATSATNFMLMIISSLFSPLLPAMASMQATSTPEAIGRVMIRISRYCTLTLCALSLPLLLTAFPLLSLWVGHIYALKTVLFLQILVVSNCLRQLCYPYSLVVIATGKQNLATLASVGEAAVNLAVSLWLGQRLGALGIALGTLAGATVSIVMHLTISMKLTRSAIDVAPSCFIVQSLLRPLACVLPLVLLFSSWNRTSMMPARPSLLVVWVFSTLCVMYTIGLTSEDRAMIWEKLASLRAGKAIRLT